mmetsp:Transcript_38988/g.81966  ORF Transcript_38988/g.81966 Transcript_38988/m.81966 type:complete len:446 (+) Transcript_38988:44-1381(+)
MGKKSRRPKSKQQKGKDKAGSSTSAKGKGGRGSQEKAKPLAIRSYVPDTSSFGPTPSPSSVDTFWKWFIQNEETLRIIDPHCAAQRIDRQLMRVHPGLVYELGGPGSGQRTHEEHSSNQHHLIISADGVMEVFNAVLSLIRAAPTQLDSWRFTAFRDRHFHSLDGDGMCLSYKGKSYPQTNIRYALSKEDHVDKIGIWLFMKGFDDFYTLDDERKNFFGCIGFLYLDRILGEYDVEMHIGEVAFKPQKGGMYKKIDTYPLSQLPHDFDGWLSEKIGPKPREGWAALANLGCPLDVGGSASKKSPTSVTDGVDVDEGVDDTPTPLTAATRCGVIGMPPEDPRADLMRGLFKGLVTDEGMAMMDSIIPTLDNTGLEEYGMDWDKKVPIGSIAEIVNLTSRTDLNGEKAWIVSHIYDTLRIGVRVISTNEELAIRPVNVPCTSRMLNL